jgi:predicted nucleic acid-binding Zn ribbon protein
LLGVRRRALDVLTYGVFGLLMLAVALTITGGPLATA